MVYLIIVVYLAGAAILQKDADNYLDLIKYASCALDASKKKGKNTCTFFSSDLIQAQNRSMEISDQLSHAIVKDMENFEVYYQPLTNVKRAISKVQKPC